MLVLLSHLVVFQVEDALFQLVHVLPFVYLVGGAGEVQFVAAVVLEVYFLYLIYFINFNSRAGDVCLDSLFWLPVAMYDLLIASRVEC